MKGRVCNGTATPANQLNDAIGQLVVHMCYNDIGWCLA
jgi:hypothetical protein